MGKPDSIQAKLKAIPLFHDFTEAEIEMFLDLSDPTAYDAGEVIVREGETGDCMFYVADGRCRALTRQGEREIVLADLGPGEIVGELAMFDRQPRCADVKAVDFSVLLKVNEGVLRALAGVYPSAAFKFLAGIAREMGKRVRKSNARFLDSVLGVASQE